MNKDKKKILVVLGGISRERDVSLKSGTACASALKDLGYNVNFFDPKKKQFNTINKRNVDIIFNALHGEFGEDGIAQSFFEYLKIPYTHSGVISSMQAMDKVISKKIFKFKKILSPRYFVINNQVDFKNIKTKIKINKLRLPIVIKPTNEGSSIGVFVCINLKDLENKFKNLRKKYKDIIFEQFIPGQEIQVATMKNKALGAIELRPKRKFYDYKAKYLKSAKTDHIMPANINKKKYLEVLKIAEKTHKALHCKGVTRCDFKFYKNKFYLLEINTQPGMTSLSLVPEIAKYRKISFKKLINDLVLDASINR